MLAGCCCCRSARRCGASALWISQSVRVVTENGAYTHVEIEWKFDPNASEDEIPAIDEDKDGKFSRGGDSRCWCAT